MHLHATRGQAAGQHCRELGFLVIQGVITRSQFGTRDKLKQECEAE